MSHTWLSASHNLGAGLHPFLRRERGGEEPAQVTSSRVVGQRANVYPEACAQLPAHPQKCPRAESSGRPGPPGKPVTGGPDPRGRRKVPTGRDTAGRDREGPEGPVGVPRPPRTTRPGRERASRTARTPAHRPHGHSRRRKRYSPAGNLRLKRADWTREPEPAPGGEDTAPSADTARPAPPLAASGACAALPGRAHFQALSGEGERVRRGARRPKLEEGNRQARFCGRD